MSSGTDATPQAPFSPELLADLHADALPEEFSRRLWPQVRLDAESMRVIATLDAVSAQLREIGEDQHGSLPIPPEVIGRIDRTIEAIEPHTHLSGDGAIVPLRRRHRRGRLFLGIAAAAAVLAVVSIVATTVWQKQAEPETIAAEPAPALDPSLVLDSSELDPSFAFGVIGKRDPGSLANPSDLAACMSANGVDPDASLLGSSRVQIDGRDGTLLVIAGAHPSQFIALAVGTDCSANNPDVLTRRDIG